MEPESSYAAARARWPELDVPHDRFVAYLAARGHAADPAVATAADLYLACACGDGDTAAHQLFARIYDAVIRAALRHFAALGGELDDAVQRTLGRLLVSRGDEPAKIALYSGRAELASFVRVVATRVALSMLRGHDRRATDDSGLDLLASGDDDPELAYLKELYRDEFRAAFAIAVQRLPSRDRSLLRYQIVEGLSIDEIAAIYDRPRSSVGRHLLEARARLVQDTRVVMRAQLGVDDDELRSILRLVRSAVDVSVRRLLGPHG